MTKAFNTAVHNHTFRGLAVSLADRILSTISRRDMIFQNWRRNHSLQQNYLHSGEPAQIMRISLKKKAPAFTSPNGLVLNWNNPRGVSIAVKGLDKSVNFTCQ